MRLVAASAGLMSLIHNERIKHLSSWFNALATAVLATGIFAPAAALLYGLSDPRLGAPYVILVGLTCLLGGVGLHFAGRAMLGRLRE
jgi:hypothetical protein